MPEFRARWLVACSCGWKREASSACAATAIAKLHARHLGAPGTDHIITIEEPPIGDPLQQPDLPLV